MKTVATTVNISFKYPISEEKLCALIKTGKIEAKYAAHMFAFFTDVPVPDIVNFVKKFSIPMSALQQYYKKYVKPFYPNKTLEEVFVYE